MNERRESRGTLVDEEEFCTENLETVQDSFEKYKRKDNQNERKFSSPSISSDFKSKFGHKRSKSDVSHSQGRQMMCDWNKLKIIPLRNSSKLTNSLETGW